jgi:pimeloyl-ACP methyl ester carboxylesterase
MKKIVKVISIIVVIMIGIPLLILLFRPSLIVAKADAKAQFTQPTSHYVQWRGAEIHYTDEGQGIPVMLIHGYGGSHRNFQKLNDRMKDKYRVIRIDLPGFGLSDLPGSKEEKMDFLKMYSDFFTFMLDTLHTDSVYMVGNSMGGMMAWNAALQHTDKVKKLVLIGSAGYELDKIAKGVSRMMNIPFMGLFYSKGMPLTMSEGGARKVYADTSKINHAEVINNNKIWNRDGNLDAAYRLMQSQQYPDSTRITQITIPTLIIWGKNDQIVPVAHAYKFERDIKGSQLVILDTCGHVPMIEKADETAGLIKKFFGE